MFEIRKIWDIHAHIWRGTYESNAMLLRRAAAWYHIDRIFVSALGSNQPDKGELDELNRATADLCKQDSLFYGYVYLNPLLPDCLTRLRQGIERDGMLGVKLWVSCLCNDKACDPIYEYCAAENVPVLLHAFEKTHGRSSGESTAVHVRQAAMRHPNTQFIMAHLGANCYTNLPLIADLPNVATDFSGTICRADDLPYALDLLGSERILFGSDMPASFCASFAQVLDADLTQQEADHILFRNAQRLFVKARCDY